MATPALLRATLFCLPLVDELVSGIPVLTLPLAREELGFSYAQAGLIFPLAELTGLVVNPALDVVSDHWSKPRLVMGGLLGLALGFALAGSSPTFGWLLFAFVIMGATNGAVVGLGGNILIDQAPDAALATTTRWVFLATIGDLLGPLLVAGTVALQGSWRLLMSGGAVIWLIKARQEDKKRRRHETRDQDSRFRLVFLSSCLPVMPTAAPGRQYLLGWCGNSHRSGERRRRASAGQRRQSRRRRCRGASIGWRRPSVHHCWDR